MDVGKKELSNKILVAGCKISVLLILQLHEKVAVEILNVYKAAAVIKRELNSHGYSKNFIYHQTRRHA